jgi:hypothetical protein
MKIARIEQDEFASSPREDEANVGVLFCAHRRYELGDTGAVDPRTIPDDIYVQLPVYLYDHSGLTLSTSPFSCPWDSGQVGVIYITHERAARLFPDRSLSKEFREQLLSILEDEVALYNQFVQGDVYYFTLLEYDPKTDPDAYYAKAVDSVGGFYGADPLTNGMLDYVTTSWRYALLKAYEGMR